MADILIKALRDIVDVTVLPHALVGITILVSSRADFIGYDDTRMFVDVRVYSIATEFVLLRLCGDKGLLICG